MNKSSKLPDAAEVALGVESSLLDGFLSNKIDEETRHQIWTSAKSILSQGPIRSGVEGKTGLALGYVQSGKTTSITALIAEAADQGYGIIVAILGVTNLLLTQNRARIEGALGIDKRNDFRWVIEENPSGRRKALQISDWLQRGRVVLVPVLKHAGRINKLADVFSQVEVAGLSALIIDDEADQASLNTEVGSDSLSRTYESITKLRAALPRSLYVQYTATPYAPLLVEKSDHLLPQFVEFLRPGPGYIGGSEFFVDYSAQVVRNVPLLEEQTSSPPINLPLTLVDALGSFIAGAALILSRDGSALPVSMLVHSTHRNDVQSRYHYLLNRQIRAWKAIALSAISALDLPNEITNERERLVGLGAPDVGDEVFLGSVKFALSETVLWLVNSTEAVHKVNWKVAPVHILVGGNKLDRGFTVEGLTVTYMNRRHSDQIDTLEQRARAFGYRRDQLPFCQFFASKRSIKILRDIVFTEYDLRARLRDYIDAGGSISAWADNVGLLLPSGTRPTRQNVVRALSCASAGWRSLRFPLIDDVSLAFNRAIVDRLGLFVAPYFSYGRLKHRTLRCPLSMIVDEVVRPWKSGGYSPGWRREDLLELLDRYPIKSQTVAVLLLEEPEGGPRIRKWDSDIGFVNLFQGADLHERGAGIFYEGDRAVPDILVNPDQIVLQIHRVVRRDDCSRVEILTPALYLGDKIIVRGDRASS